MNSRYCISTRILTQMQQDLWIRNFYYITEDTFPTIHRRSQIVRKEVIETSPIENAYNAMKEKNKELEEFTIRMRNDQEQLQRFTMVLQGTINAAVNGGTEKYKDAFFNEEFERENPEKLVSLVKLLKEELAKQLSILEEGMTIHKKKCTAEMVGLHDLLEVKFVEMKQKAQVIQ